MFKFRRPTKSVLSGGYVCSTQFRIRTPEAPHIWSHIKDTMTSYLAERGMVAGRPISVIIEVPEALHYRDKITGAGLERTLSRELEQLHEQSYKKFGAARYQVRLGQNLESDEVRLITGAAVHVPAADEPVSWRIQMSQNGTHWDALPTMEMTRDHLSAVLGRGEGTSHTVPGWPFGKSQLAIVNEPDAPELQLIALDASLEIHYRADTRVHIIRHRPQPAGPEALPVATGHFFVKATRLSAREVVLPSQSWVPPAAAQAAVAAPRPAAVTADKPQGSTSQRLEPIFDLVPAPPVHATPLVMADADGLEDTGTLLAQPQRTGSGPLADEGTLFATPQAMDLPRLQLAGLAIQRPSCFISGGVKALHWGLDARGQVVPPQSKQCLTRFEVGADDAIWVQTQEGRSQLDVGDTVNVDGGETLLPLLPLPDSLRGDYIACLKIGEGQQMPLDQSAPITVGRQMNVIRSLRPLAGPGFLPGLTDGERMGLSREHLQMTVTQDGLLVSPLGSNRVTLLDADLQFVAQIDAARPTLVADGHHIVVGHYLWRYWQ